MALARWQATIADEAGNALPGASIEVRRETVALPIAALYQDRDGAVPIGNPFQAGGDGFAAFHAAGGAYRITVTKGGFTRTWRYVAIGTGAEFDVDRLDQLLFTGIGNDLIDDGPALQMALDAAGGRTVRLIPGLTYRIATPIVTRSKNWTLDARGARIRVDANVNGLSAFADIDNLQSVSAIAGANVTVASGAAFAVGDHVRVISDDVPVNARTVIAGDGYKSGEPCIVKSIAGNVLTMESPLIYGAALLTNRRIFRMPLEEQVRIIGGAWSYTEGRDATPWAANMISLIGLINPRVEDVRITRGYGAGVALIGTQHAYVSGLRTERLTDNIANSQFGYGLADGGYNTVCVGISGESVRHLVTTNPLTAPAATTDEDRLHRYGHCRGLRVLGGTCMGASSTAFDTHHQSEDISFCDLYAENCPSAVSIRAQHARVTNVEGRNCTGPIVQVLSEFFSPGVSDGPATEAGWASDVHIDNILGNGDQVLSVLRAKDVHIGRVHATAASWRAFEVVDSEVFLHDDIEVTVADTTNADAGRGVFDVDDVNASFVPSLEQRSGRIKISGSGSPGSTSFTAVKADAAAVVMRDLEVIFPTGSVGPMLITANGGTLEADMKFDIAGAAETGMALTSGTGIAANVQSNDGTRDQFNLRRKAREPLKWISAGEPIAATIAAGAIAATASFMVLDTEAGAATDDLDTITGGCPGDVLVLRSAATPRNVVVRHNGGGTGNIFLDGQASKALDNILDRLTLQNINGTTWVQLAFSNNGPDT